MTSTGISAAKKLWSITQKYHWKNISGDVEEYVKSCKKCLLEVFKVFRSGVEWSGIVCLTSQLTIFQSYM